MLTFLMFALLMLSVNFAFIKTHDYPLGRLQTPKDMPFHWGNIKARESVNYYPPFYYSLVWGVDFLTPFPLLVDVTLVNWAFLCLLFPLSCAVLSYAVFREQIYAHYTLFLSIFGVNAFNTFMFTWTFPHLINLVFINLMVAAMIFDLERPQKRTKWAVLWCFNMAFLSHAVGRYLAVLIMIYYLLRKKKWADF